MKSIAKERDALRVRVAELENALENALETMRAYADATHCYWDIDEDLKVGKRLLAMAGQLPGYEPQIDAALKAITTLPRKEGKS
jgi:hypothetical protein